MMDPEGMRQLLIERAPGASRELRTALEALGSGERESWLDAVLGVDPFVPDESDLPRNCVPYLPCPVDVLLRMVDQAQITSRDVFVDIGSGVGRAAGVVHFLTGAAVVGLEVQRALVSRAHAMAAALNLERCATVEGDAAELVKFVQVGTVFFLYCPFSGARLERVLDHIEDIARTRAVRVCCVQLPALNRSWLEPVSSEEELSIYQSRAVLADAV
jgi:precorrin-6B methylase 2